MSQAVLDTLDLFGQEKDSKSVIFLVVDSDGDGNLIPRDISSWQTHSIIKNADGTDASANFTITPVAGNTGMLRAFLPSDHGLIAAVYSYEIDVSEGNTRETALQGKLTIQTSLFED